MSLKHKAVNGTFWDIFGTFGSGAINFFVTMVLARLLTPHDFGLIELILIFSVVSKVVIESGFSQAVIRDKSPSQTDLSSVFYFSCVIALLIYLFLFFLSPLISSFYNEPEMNSLCRFTFLIVVFDSFSVIQNANCIREINFKIISISSVLGALFSSIISLIFAFLDFGVWSLSINLVSFSFFKMVILWSKSNWMPSWNFSFLSLKKYFSFGIHLLLQGIIDRIVINLESLLIGKFYSKSNLGNLSQAKKIDSYFIHRLSNVLNRVSFPLFSKINSFDDKLKYTTKTCWGIITYIMFPISIFMLVSAKNIIVVLFGQQWIEAVPYMQIWSIACLFSSVTGVFRNILLAKGKSQLCLYITLLTHLCRIFVIVFLLQQSIFHLLIGVMILTILNSLFFVYLGGKSIDYNLKDVLLDAKSTFMISAFSGLIVFFSGYCKIESSLIVLAIQSLIMLSSFILLSFLFKNKNFPILCDILKVYINRKKN